MTEIFFRFLYGCWTCARLYVVIMRSSLRSKIRPHELVFLYIPSFLSLTIYPFLFVCCFVSVVCLFVCFVHYSFTSKYSTFHHFYIFTTLQRLSPFLSSLYSRGRRWFGCGGGGCFGYGRGGRLRRQMLQKDDLASK